MTIELARVQALAKPWGVADLRPWSKMGSDCCLVGEVWYERAGGTASEPSLLLKLLFTSQPMGNAVFAQSDHIDIQAGPARTGLVAYAGIGAPVPRGLAEPDATRPERPDEMQMATSLTRASDLG